MRQQDYLDIGQALDIEGFRRGLIAFANKLDFGIVTTALVTEKPGREPLFIVTAGNTPDAYLESHLNPEIGRRDPVMKRLKHQSTPFAYDQAMYVNEGAADVWDHQAPFGFRTGISTALHLPGGIHFIIGVDRHRALPKNDRVVTRMMADLQLLAIHAQSAAMRLYLTDTAACTNLPRLTPRECEVLKWTYEGKTAWEVGRILTMSEHTVNFHVRGAMRKFGVPSKHQAAVKAVSMALI